MQHHADWLAKSGDRNDRIDHFGVYLSIQIILILLRLVPLFHSGAAKDLFICLAASVTIP